MHPELHTSKREAHWLSRSRLRSQAPWAPDGATGVEALGATKIAEFINIFYGNVTLIPKSRALSLSALSDGVWMAGESHVRKEVLTRRCHHRSKHCEITAAPAAQSPDFAVGTYGGVLTSRRGSPGPSGVLSQNA